jgi:hypothetical protein
LEIGECISNGWHATELVRSVSNGVVFKLKQVSQLFLSEFLDTLFDILRKSEIEERLKF